MEENHAVKALGLADQIMIKAREAVADLEREMALRKWPAEFQAIMWDAVSSVAQTRAHEARKS